MNIIKVAIINMSLKLVELSTFVKLQGDSFVDLYETRNNKIANYLHGFIQKDVDTLKQNNIIDNTAIVIDFISGIQPTELTSSVDCELNILKLKALQDLLLQMNYQIKIIL